MDDSKSNEQNRIRLKLVLNMYFIQKDALWRSKRRNSRAAATSCSAYIQNSEINGGSEVRASAYYAIIGRFRTILRLQKAHPFETYVAFSHTWQLGQGHVLNARERTDILINKLTNSAMADSIKL